VPEWLSSLTNLLEVTYDRENDAIANTISQYLQVVRNERDKQVKESGYDAYKVLQEWGVHLDETQKQTFNEFNSFQKCVIVEWLRRMANTQDYKVNETDVITTVASMLKSALEDACFRDTFFAQVEVNLECCGDRSSMAFNEMYTYWRMTDKTLRKDDMFSVLCSGARTIALRKAVMKEKITQRSESVEVYLWVEVTLKDRLELLTHAKTLKFGIMNGSVNLDKMVQRVNDTWPHELFDMVDATPLEFKEKNDYPRTLPDDVARQYDVKLDEVEDASANGSLDSDRYVAAMNKLKVDRDAELTQLKLAWLQGTGQKLVFT